MWEPKNAEEALSIALLTEFGLLDGPGVVDMSLTEAVGRMMPRAQLVIERLVEDGYRVVPRTAE